MGKKKQGSTLGVALLKQKSAASQGKRISADKSLLHTAELADGYDWGRLNLQSVTEESSFAEFLNTAELAGVEFEAEKHNVTFVTPISNPGVLSAEEKKKIKTLHQTYKNKLRIPRRPTWNRTMTSSELDTLERESFLEWRRSLSLLQEVDGIVMTPYERNIEFWRQLWRVVEKSDILIQILDARNPLMFRCEDLEDYAHEISTLKKCALLINKADYLTVTQRTQWAQYFTSVGVKVFFYSCLETEPDLTTENHDVRILTRDELISAFKSLRRDGITGPVTVGLVGYPNVGKSSTINSLCLEKKVSVSKTPGKTKHFQTIIIDPDLTLCDCPGLVMPSFASSKAEMVLWGILPIDQLRDHVPPVNMIVSMFPNEVFEDMYGVMLPEDMEITSQELLNSYAYIRGFMTSHGLPDNPRASRYILKDFVSGKLLYCHAPPGGNQEEFHTFKFETHKVKHVPVPLARFNKPNKATAEDLDQQFFEKTIIQPHYKAINGQTVFVTGDETDSKPWKKHKNFKKKEKLRRVYRHLDV